MAKRKNKAAPTPPAVPAGADPPASRARTARKRSRLSDPALENGHEVLALVGTEREQPQGGE
eukprot:5173744-Prymnesium_polylepis.1